MASVAARIWKAGRRLFKGGQQPGPGRMQRVELIDNLSQVVFQLDQAGKWVYLNSAWSTLTGHPLTGSVGSHHQIYFHPADSDLVNEHLKRIARWPQDIAPVTVRLLRKDNRYRWVTLQARSLRGDGNTASGPVAAGTLTDVTEQVHARELQQAKLRGLENLTANLPGMLYRRRNENMKKMDYVSAGCVALTGYKPEDFVNNNASWAELIHTEDRSWVFDRIQYSLQQQQPFDLRYRIVTAGNEVKWVLETGIGSFASSGQLLSVEGCIVDSTRRQAAESRLRRAALYDADTGLPNPSLFTDRLQCVVEKRRADKTYNFALLLISVDQSQYIQSSNIDKVVATIGSRLHETLASNNSISLLSDDLLAVLLDGYTSIKEVTNNLRQIQEQVQAPITVEDSHFYVTASIGVALAKQGYKLGDDMLEAARTALSRAQTLGGARYEISDLYSHAKAATQSQTHRELRQALTNGEFQVFWQPVVYSNDGRLAGLEAKMVWPHPRKGLLFIDSFAPHAMATQLITPLWEWMFTEARRQTNTWLDLPGVDDLALTVQFTGNTLLDAESILRLGGRLLAAKLPPFTLAVGVPAHVLNQTSATIQSMLRRLAARDIHLVVEQFGAGSVELALLQAMPINAMRLVPQLVADCVGNDGRYIQALNAFADRLGIAVIAEGVETRQQLEVLKAINVDFVQGDYISPPIDAEATWNMLERIDAPQTLAAFSVGP